jgi:hypothetical protein
MDTIKTSSFIEAITTLLEEVHVGPPDPHATWITSNRPGSGFLGTLDAMSAETASTPPGPGANTIAAHAGHLLFALSLALRAMHGENPYGSVKWSESWHGRRFVPTCVAYTRGCSKRSRRVPRWTIPTSSKA